MMWRLALFHFLADFCGVGCALLSRQAGSRNAALGGGPPPGFVGGPPVYLWSAPTVNLQSVLPPGDVPGFVGPEFMGPSGSSLISKLCCPGDPTRSIFNVTKPTIVPFFLDPSAPAKTDAAMLVIPGGGFDFLAWEKEGTDIALWLNQIGITAFVLKYRVPIRPWVKTTTHKKTWLSGASVEDAMRAMSLIRHSATQRKPNYAFNPNKIGAIGFSAGGEIATQLYSSALSRGYKKIDFVDEVPFSPDFLMLIYSQGYRFLPEGNFYKLPAPPTFLASAENDQCELASMVRLTADALKKKGAEVDLHIYPDGFHGYGRCSLYTTKNKDYSVCDWPQQATNWLYKHVTGQPASEVLLQSIDTRGGLGPNTPEFGEDE